MTACATSSPGATSCRRAAAGRSAWTRCTARLACCAHGCVAMRTPRREPVTKPVGKPDAGNPHVRFDERGGETNCLRSTAPLLDSTGGACVGRGRGQRPERGAGAAPSVARQQLLRALRGGGCVGRGRGQRPERGAGAAPSVARQQPLRALRGGGCVGRGRGQRPERGAGAAPSVARQQLLRAFRCAPTGCDHLVGASPTRAMVGWPGSWQAVWLGNWLDRSPATKVAVGG